MTERKRIISTTEGAWDGPGAAIIADAEFDGCKVIVYIDGNEIARSDVTPGDNPWAVAKKLLPRPRMDFWRPQPKGPGVPY
jgi:hypothetical protein